MRVAAAVGFLLPASLAFAQLAITPTPLPDGTVGASYSATATATGGTAPYDWSTTTGLPPGLGIAGTGATATISGIPSQANTFLVNLVVRDASLPPGSPSVSRTVSLTVFSAVSVTTTSLADAAVGVPYSASLTPSGGKSPYTWSATGLPAGITVSGSQLTGTPTAAGTFSVNLQVKDANNAAASRTVSLTVAPAVAITIAALPNGTVGTDYSVSLTASGGRTPYTWTATGLPPGISVNGDQLKGKPTAAGNYTPLVKVTDKNNLSDSQSFSVTIVGALAITNPALPSGVVGASYSATLTATGGTPPYTFNVTGLPPGVTFNAQTGALSGTPTAAGSFSVKVTVTDSASRSANATFPVQVVTGLAITTASLPSGAIGTAYSATLTAAGGTAPYTWSVISGSLPAGLSLNTSSGTISGTPTAAGASNITFQAADSGTLSTSKGFTLSISSALSLGGTLAGGAVGAPYSSALAASGGTPPYTYSLQSGTLPPGLALNSGTGAIAGTPTQTGTFSFAGKVTDNAGATATGNFSIRILSGVSIVTGGVPSGTIGTAYTQTLVAMGGTPPYTWSLTAGSLPAGIALSPGGVLGGVPSGAGSYTFTVQAHDSAGLTATRDLVLNIASSLTIATTSPLPAGSVGTLYSQTFVVLNGVAPFTWSVSAGSLPPGLSLNSTTGALRGAPATTGTFVFTIAVSDSSQASTAREFQVTVVNALTVSTTSLPGGALNTPYTATLAAVAGTSPYTWSVTSGNLPLGLTLNAASGVISGTPTATGRSRFTVQVQDAVAATDTQALSITIGAQLSVTSGPALPGGELGKAYSQTLQAAGGSPPYTWALTGGALPDGLTLASDGALSGVPAAGGSFSFTVRVSDAAASAATAALTLAISSQGLPAVAITGLPETAGPLEQPTLALSLAKPAPVALTGQLTITFAPDAAVAADDPAIQFSTNGRTVSFTIAANAKNAVFPGGTLQLQTGSVSGKITVTAKLSAGGSDVTPSPAPSASITIARSAPVIRSVQRVSTTGGFEVWITGYSPPRELTQAVVTFHAAAGSNLQTTQVTIPLTDAARGWYQDSGSAQYGSQFTIVQPFQVQGNANAVASVSVTLANSVGTSAAASN